MLPGGHDGRDHPADRLHRVASRGERLGTDSDRIVALDGKRGVQGRTGVPVTRSTVPRRSARRRSRVLRRGRAEAISTTPVSAAEAAGVTRCRLIGGSCGWRAGSVCLVLPSSGYVRII